MTAQMDKNGWNNYYRVLPEIRGIAEIEKKMNVTRIRLLYIGNVVNDRNSGEHF